MAFWLTLTTKDYGCLSLYQCISSPPLKMGEHVAACYGIIKYLMVLLFQHAETNVGTNYAERNILSVKEGWIVLCELISRHSQMLKSSDDRRHQLAFSQTFC